MNIKVGELNAKYESKVGKFLETNIIIQVKYV